MLGKLLYQNDCLPACKHTDKNMLAFIQFALINLLFLISQVSSQNNFKPSITCYVIYESEETRIDKTNAELNSHYYQMETTQYQTPESELCSKVDCACFSYKSACSYSSPGTNHVSKCTDDDRQKRIIKWHRGWTSQARCEAMHQQPQTYSDLTCCFTDRCNNQPGKITKIVEAPVPVQLHELYGYQNPQPLSIVQKPSQKYDTYAHQAPQILSVSHKPPQQYSTSITCYMMYQSEETKIDRTDAVLSFHYHQTESTQYQTPENELCSKVGCACFSYRRACSYSSSGTNHVSNCTDADRKNSIIKWHRGWASQARCEAMHQQPEIYSDLTCCFTDRCNNQPGKVTKIVEAPVQVQLPEFYGYQTPQPLSIVHKPSQQYDTYGHQNPQLLPVSHKPFQTYDAYDRQAPQPLPIAQTPPQRYSTYDQQTPQPLPVSHKTPKLYDTYDHQTPQHFPVSHKPSPRYATRIRHPTTSRLPDTDKPSEAYEKSLSSTTSLVSSSFSSWMIFFSLMFCLLIIV